VLECGCQVEGEGIAAEVVTPCAESQAAINGLLWAGHRLLTRGPEWERYRDHFAALRPDEDVARRPEYLALERAVGQLIPEWEWPTPKIKKAAAAKPGRRRLEKGTARPRNVAF